MKRILIIILAGACTILLRGQDLPLLKISDDHRYVVTQDNKPFFWLGGTAWEMIHRLKKEEIDLYLSDRAEKGFTIIQTVILAELDGLNTPNAYGFRPLINNEPEKLNEDYFELVDYVVQRAGQLGLYVGLLPTWGDKFNRRWGTGPEIFDPQNAEKYGAQLAARYRSENNLVWILGGDRIPENDQHIAIVRAMARGIRKTDPNHLITYHPAGSRTASEYFNEKWLDLDMFQSGHSRTSKEYQYVLDCRRITPPRPVINGEARYENIRDRFWEAQEYGWLDDADARVSAYWTMISGAAGYTYGCNDIWQMFDISREPVLQARTGWKEALILPGSTQMGYMRAIFEKLPWQTMKYDPSLIRNENIRDEAYIVAAIGESGGWMVAYTPMGRPITLDIQRIQSELAEAFWYNPRSGDLKNIGEFRTTEPMEFTPWAEGWGSDFLLIVKDKKSNITL